MAIIPKSKYPAQVEVSDVGYPFGKARNVGVPGDGSGTPWEADLANDVFGFQQALLVAGGVSPSNAPDKVGASQYLTAMKSVIKQGTDTLAATLYQFASFVDKPYTWLGNHGFKGSLGAFGAFVIGGTSNEIVYGDAEGVTTPRTRIVMLPLRPTFQPAGLNNGSYPDPWTPWLFAPTPTPQWSVADSSRSIVFLFGAELVPTGARIRAVRAQVNASAGATLTFNAVTWSESGGAESADHTATLAAGPLAVHVMETLCDEPVDNATQTFRVTLKPDADIGLMLRWIHIEFMDPGPRNF